MRASKLFRRHRISAPVKVTAHEINIRRCFYFLLFAAVLICMICFLIGEEDEDYAVQDLTSPTEIMQNGSVEPYPACRIPQLDPFDKSIQQFLKERLPLVNCEKKYPLLFNSTLDSTIVPAKGEDYFRLRGIKSCHYRTLTRSIKSKQPDNNVKVSQKSHPLSLTSDTVIPPEQEFIAIYCRRKRFPRERMMDVHAFVPFKEPEIQTSNEISNLGGKRKWNVVILGLDAVSRMNFLRTMPKTFAFLKNELGAVEMAGYNKVAGNTFSIIVPLLTSKKTSELFCTSRDGKINNCPFIWKEYSKQGYYTSFAEDAPDIAIFNHGKPGFKQQPTDYYPRPMILAASKISTNHQKSAALCYGPRLTFQILLDYMKKFVHRMSKSKKPYFQLTWSTALTHDILGAGLIGDQYLLQSLQWMKQSGYLNNTIFILMSDHGNVVGKIRNSIQGSLEDRLPFMHLVLPDDFKKQYNLAYQTLLNNSDKLVTTFDLHETLQDILYPENIEDSSLAGAEDTLFRNVRAKVFSPPRGISLFRPIPVYRTCKMAGIEAMYCACNYLRPASTNTPLLEKLAMTAVTQINSLLSESPDCAKLQLDKVTLAQHAGRPGRFWEAYLVNFQTKPGEGLFEALVGRDNKAKPWKVEGTVARTNSYGNQSQCVSDVLLKHYCYCLES